MGNEASLEKTQPAQILINCILAPFKIPITFAADIS